MAKDSNKCDFLSAIMVIFGGTGDLTHRKLMPALYNLVHSGILPDGFAIVALGRKEKTQEQYKNEIHEALRHFSRNELDESHWNKMKNMIHYVCFDFTKISGYVELNEYIESIEDNSNTCGNRLYYLAVAPEHFETIVHGLHIGGMNRHDEAWRRLVIEKPFGKDLETARKLNQKLLEVFPERDIYRIDHYLGKDMIQNIMVLRFCNSVFESLWSNRYIDNIQITLAEKHGVETRGGYYETSGAMRDMIQNHILQIMALVAMEPPVNLDTDSIRTEKLKVIQSIQEMTPELLRDNVIFGQYGKGYIDGQPVPAYRDEEKVDDYSIVETFVALKLHLNNFRWSGTPFYIRTGKRFPYAYGQIVIQFKTLPNILYFGDGQVQEPNLLVIRIQPNVGVFFQFNTKDMQKQSEIITTKMDTSGESYSKGNSPEAYERLLYDALRGDAALFTRWDAVEASWIFADKIIKHRVKDKFQFPNYAAGSTGPVRAHELLARDGRKWWDV